MKRIHLHEWREEEGRAVLLGATCHRARNVLRVRPGETLTAGDGRGRRLLLEVAVVEPERVECLIRRTEPDTGESSLAVTLAQAVPRQARMDLVVQKATELGVRRIVPLLCGRSVSRPAGEGVKAARWERIAREAAAQCRRSQAPTIDPPTPLRRFLEASTAPARLVLDPGPGSVPLSSLEQRPPSAVEVIVGPEGGLSPEELEACRAAGFVAVSLGPRVLRSETAGVAVLAILQHRWGDLG